MEKQLKQHRHEDRRDRCVSVQKMERSLSPMIPKLDLSKVKPYDKDKPSVQSTQIHSTVAMKHSLSPSILASGNSTLNNVTITNMSMNIMDDSGFHNRKSTGYSATSSGTRKKSNPPIPPLDLSRLTTTDIAKKKLPSFDNQSIDAWQVKIERFP